MTWLFRATASGLQNDFRQDFCKVKKWYPTLAPSPASQAWWGPQGLSLLGTLMTSFSVYNILGPYSRNAQYYGPVS
jgi:hypothetical protein